MAGELKTIYDFLNWFYRRSATIGGVLLLVVLFVLGWVFVLVGAIFLLGLSQRQKIYSGIKYILNWIKLQIRHYRFGRADHKQTQKDKKEKEEYGVKIGEKTS